MKPNLLASAKNIGICISRRTLLFFVGLLLFTSAYAQVIPVIGDTSVCAGETVTYSVPSQPNSSYSWSGGVTGGNLIGATNTNTANIAWGPAGIGTIVVTIFTPGGPQYATLNVIIHPNPQPVISHAPYPTCASDSSGGGTSGQPQEHKSCQKVCEFSTITYTTPFHPGSTYQWFATGHSAISGQLTDSVTVTWDNTLNGSLTVIETNQWGCVDSAEICVKKISRPVAFFTTQSSVCLSTPNLFNNLSTGASTYQWYFGDGGSSTATNPSYPYPVAGTYTVTLIAYNACHCVDTFTATVTVDSLPGPDIQCPSTVCAFDSGTYYTNAAGCTYQWGAIGGTIVGPSNQQQVNVAWGAGAVGTLWLYVSGCGALCTDTTFVHVPIVPANDTIAGDKRVCSPSCAHYSVTLFSGATYTWSLSGSGTIVYKHCNEVDICWPAFYQGNDTLNVAFFDSFLNCGGTAQLIIRVRSELAVLGNSTVCVNSLGSFFANPSIPCTWSISPAGPTILGNFTPNITVNWNNTPGNYIISAVPLNPNAVCNDSATISVKVVALPPAPDIVGDTIICPGNSYSYCSTVAGTVNWLITGGTPTNGIGNCITVTWNGTGPYSVRAFQLMTGMPFCSSDTTTQNVMSAVPLPLPNINGPINDCVNDTSLIACTTLYPSGTLFNWTILPSSAGTVISGQGTSSIIVEWGNTIVPITIQLTVTACNLQSTSIHPVTLNPAPTPVVIQTGILCPGVPATLTATGGAFTAYNWTGPSYTSITNPTTITVGGIYHVTVTAAITGCRGSADFTAVAQPAPIASISTADYLRYCIGTPFIVQLNALTNPGYTFLWSNASVLNPTPVITAGSYNVTVTDANGCTAQSNTLTVVVDSCNGGTGNPCIPNAAAVVQFTHPAFYGCNPMTFLNTSISASSFTWNFGDLTTANTFNGVHTYAQAGFYLVTLSGYVPNAAGTDSCLMMDTAHVEVPLVSIFKYQVGCLNNGVKFTDLSVYTPGNSITSWSWNFGDANTSILQNPTHVYAGPGTYTVTLTISNGTCSTTSTQTITVLPLPTAAFTYPLSACLNSTVLFTDASTTVGSINSWTWDFGDGGSSLNQNPSHSFNLPITFTVQLIVKDTLGCVDTVSNNISIVSPTPIGPITAFPDTIVCAGTPVLLVAPFCTGCTYLWSAQANNSTNDSVTVTSTGIYVVQVTDPNGCVASVFIRIIVHPAPPAIITNSGSDILCVGDFASLTTIYSQNYLYSWISNDTTANGTTGSGVYVNSSVIGPGVYTYQVVVVDTTTGCTDTSQPYTIWIYPNPVPPTITPLGAITFCAGDTVWLVGSHPDPTITLQWSTGETTDTIAVTEGGTYALFATDSNGCKSKATIAITVNPAPELCCFYTGCVDTCRPFTIYAPAGNAFYQWLLNDTAILGATLPYYTAVLSGSYSVILTTALGCTDTAGPLELMLHDCFEDSVCAELVIDSTGCDSSGHHVIWYHVINYSGVTINELSLIVLPPHQNTIYGPVSSYQNVVNGGSSTIQMATFYTASDYDTVCFKVHVAAFDTLGEELLCCYTDTECTVLPPCPHDTVTIPPKDSICCYFRYISDSVWCEQTPIGWKYHFYIKADGCGKLNLSLMDTGTLVVSNPILLNGITTITGVLNSTLPQSTLCMLFVLLDSTGHKACMDSTLCFDLDCNPTHTVPDCKFAFKNRICVGQTTSFIYNGGPTTGLTFNWVFTGGSPGTATGPGSHNITYNTVGCFPVQLSITNTQGITTVCVDTICVLAPPVASITQTGGTLNAFPSGMSYQWYSGPGYNLIAGATNQFYTPTVTGFYCVIVSNGLGCKDTACRDFDYIDGLDEAVFQNIKVYPSPADEWLKVSADMVNNADAAEIKLWNNVGAVVYERDIAPGASDININIPLRNLPTGVYMVQLRMGNANYVQRVLVRH